MDLFLKKKTVSYIDCAIGNGYDVEIDVRSIDGEYWLGHDEPQYKVTGTGFFTGSLTCGCIVKM